MARLLVRLSASRRPVPLLRPRSGYQLNRQHDVVHQLRVHHVDVGVGIHYCSGRTKDRRDGLLERGISLPTGVCLIPHRIHFVSGRKNKTSGKRSL